MNELNKGKQGEGQMAVLFGKIQQVEKNFEFTKPTFTNAPDNGRRLYNEVEH